MNRTAVYIFCGGDPAKKVKADKDWSYTTCHTGNKHCTPRYQLPHSPIYPMSILESPISDWTEKCYDFLKEDDTLSLADRTRRFQSLEDASNKIHILVGQDNHKDRHPPHQETIKVYKDITTQINSVLCLYAKNLKDNLKNKHKYMDMFGRISIKFQMLEFLLFKYFLANKKLISADIREIEVHFYMHLNFDFTDILYQELFLYILSNKEPLTSTVITTLDILEKIESFQIRKSYDTIVCLSNILNEAFAKVLESVNALSQRRQAESEISTLIRLHKVICQIMEHAQIIDITFPPLLNDILELKLKNPENIFRDLSSIKLSSHDITALISYYKSKNKFEIFRKEFMKQRSITFEENDFNNILNSIDLSDTFEFNPVLQNIELERDLSRDDRNRKIRSHLFQNDTIRRSPYAAIKGNMDMDCNELHMIKEEIRQNFKQSISDVNKFHSDMNEVMTSYYKITDSLNQDEKSPGEIKDTTYALLMLLLNYTPDVPMFIKKFYTPRLLMRIIYHERNWFELLNMNNNFDKILIQMLPAKVRKSIINLLELCDHQLHSSKSVASINAILHEIYIQDSQYEFKLPNSLPIFPDGVYKGEWLDRVSKGCPDSPGTHLTQSLHIVEVSSPFRNEYGQNITLKAPMTLASILLCFQTNNCLDISVIKETLHVERQQEPTLVNGIKSLIKVGLLNRSGSKLHLNLDPVLPSSMLHGDILFLY